MTLPYEQVYALQNTRRFLKDTIIGENLKGRVTAAMKQEIRRMASLCFRHYPSDIEIESYWMSGKWKEGVWPPLLPPKAVQEKPKKRRRRKEKRP